MDEHSVCEPVQPTYLRWPQLRETRLVELLFLEDVTAVLAMNPLSRAVPTDFLSVRVYLRSETTRSMGLGYRCGWRVQDVGLLLCWPERFNLSTLTVIDFLVHLALPVGTPLSSTEPYSLALVRAKVS